MSRTPGSVLHVIGFISLLSMPASASDLHDWRERMQSIEPLTYVCARAETPIVVDGVLDDAAWAGAAWTEDFVDIEGNVKPRPRFRTRTKLSWDDRHLYVAAEMEEPHVWGTLTEHDSVIFHDPDFEVFIDPDGDTHAYFEFEINALNTGWDLFLPKPYMDQGSAQNEWEMPGLKTAVRIHGTLNDPSDLDSGWTVEIAFPWQAFQPHTRHPGPPREHEQWRINFSRVEWKFTVENGTYRKIPDSREDNWVWSPQGVIDMHRPEMWGVVQFTRKASAYDVAITPAPGREARARALEVYYAQRDFFATHGRWASSLRELGPGFQSGDGGVTLAYSEKGYDCRVAFTREDGGSAAWGISHDRRLVLESAHH
jgi:hypothetical protein